MKIELYDDKGVLMDVFPLGDLSKEEAHDVMGQVREIVRKLR